MGLTRVDRTDHTEYFRPVRLGPQDLRDVAAVFQELDSRVQLTSPNFRTVYHVEAHRTEDVEDVLQYTDSDTLPRIHVISAELRLTFSAWHGGTDINTPNTTPMSAGDREAVEEAAERLRQIIRAREVGGLATLRQRGPGKWLLALPLAASALALAVGQPLLDVWLSRATSQAIVAIVVWATIVFLVAIDVRPKDLIRLRGQDLPWWERRPGLIGLVGVVLGIAIPLVILALERK